MVTFSLWFYKRSLSCIVRMGFRVLLGLLFGLLFIYDCTAVDEGFNASSSLISNKIKRKGDEVQMVFFLFTKQYRVEGEKVMPEKESLDRSQFDPNYPIRIIIHDFHGSMKSADVRAIKDAYLQKGNYNIFMVHWARVRSLYTGPVEHKIELVGNAVGQFVLRLSQITKVQPILIYIIAFGMGAHVAGQAGKYIKSVDPDKMVGVIYGLDPLGTSYDFHSNYSLSEYDAHYVETIHTNAVKDHEMQILKISDAAFFPNWGRNQPGCYSDTCSHTRATEYFAESLKDEGQFFGKQCSNEEEIRNKTCSSLNDEQVAMGGDPLEKKKAGVFYVPLKKASPYSYGKIGWEYYMRIHLYNDNALNGIYLLLDDLPFLNNRYVNNSWPVKFLICDYAPSNKDKVQEHCLKIKDAYLKRGYFNVFVFDWRLVLEKSYLGKLVFYGDIARIVATVAKSLATEYNIPYQYIDIIGEGKGAYIASLVGPRLRGNKINTIYALDYPGDLEKEGTTYIESIQTTTTKENGNVTVLINYGNGAPDCSRKDKNCNHLRAIDIIIDTITNNTLVAYPVKCQKDLKSNTITACVRKKNSQVELFGGVTSLPKKPGTYNADVSKLLHKPLSTKGKSWWDIFGK